MNSLWNDDEARRYGTDPLGVRVYTSRLLGREPALVLHGGGNTSVKASTQNIFGETEKLLYVKGSGWDLATIERAGFAPVKMDVLLKMAQLDRLSDTEMVRVQRTAMTDPAAPNPSVEAILHAIIPFTYVDHTHADSVVTVTNTTKGEQYIREIYGDRVLVIPYVMPGFILARKVYTMTQGIDWSQYDGMILLNHGVFTFDHDARKSYERMIALVSQAENFLKARGVAIGAKNEISAQNTGSKGNGGNIITRLKNLIHSKNRNTQIAVSAPPLSARAHLLSLARLRQSISVQRGVPVIARQKKSSQDLVFSNRENLAAIAARGPLTPDHVIRTKRVPVIIGNNVHEDVELYAAGYREYFREHNKNGNLTCLDTAPRWAVWPGQGTVTFGNSLKEADIISDIVDHTLWAIESAEHVDQWTALPAQDIFDVEYWELEQAKLNKSGKVSGFMGKIALVTGAASGIGRACVESLCAQGAVVVALDINPDIKGLFPQNEILGLVCDVAQEEQLRDCVEETVARFGGLDIVVSNAGIFPAGESIDQVSSDIWQRSMELNCSSHYRLLKECIPYLSLGVDPSIIIIASKNVPAPGPGASAYSVAKAGLTQLARVAALELGPKGIRVNVVHPNQVFDTAIWTNEVLDNRARHYGMSVADYKTNNLLKTEITSHDVANLVSALAGPVFSKTTGAQIPIDGGNERVI